MSECKYIGDCENKCLTHCLKMTTSQQEISELKEQRDEMLELLGNINACIGNEYRLPFWIESKLKQY